MTELLWALTALAGICIGYMAGRTERRLDDARSGNVKNLPRQKREEE